jgi:hypothetical protein
MRNQNMGQNFDPRGALLPPLRLGGQSPKRSVLYASTYEPLRGNYRANSSKVHFVRQSALCLEQKEEQHVICPV